MKMLSIVFLCICAAMIYGIIHDQITARICVEYFTIGHPPVFKTTSPTLLGIGWGIIATWWVGLALGIPLAMAARLGPRPRLDAAWLAAPVAILLLVMAGCALIARIIGYILARDRLIVLPKYLAYDVPADKHVPFLVDLWAHNASYLIGFIGGVVLIVATWESRRVLSENSLRNGGVSRKR